MFELDQAIADWRRQMLAAGIKTPVPLEELESHLRDDVEQQVREGFGEQQAFEIVVGRIGHANSLKMEFKKVDMADESQLRKRAGYAFAGILSMYSLAMTRTLVTNDLTSNERLLGFASVATTVLSVYVAWQFTPRFFPVIASKRLRSALGIVGGISGVAWFMAFAWFILPHCQFTQGQLTVAVFWAFVPVMVLPTISFLGIGRSESPQFTT